MTGSNRVSCDVATINGNDVKTSKTRITITPRGSKILNQAVDTFLGEGGQLQEMKPTIVSINVIGGRKRTVATDVD